MKFSTHKLDSTYNHVFEFFLFVKIEYDSCNKFMDFLCLLREECLDAWFVNYNCFDNGEFHGRRLAKKIFEFQLPKERSKDSVFNGLTFKIILKLNMGHSLFIYLTDFPLTFYFRILSSWLCILWFAPHCITNETLFRQICIFFTVVILIK